MISQSDLKDLISYDPETGIFRSLTRNRVLNGKNAAGYVQMTINKQFYYGHRLAWFYVHGEWPGYIDHINRDPGDHRIVNLRPATHSQNLANTVVRADSRSGIKGVQKTPQGRWKARIKVEGQRIHIGHFDTAQEAGAAYERAASKYFGEFRRVA